MFYYFSLRNKNHVNGTLYVAYFKVAILDEPASKIPRIIQMCSVQHLLPAFSFKYKYVHVGKEEWAKTIVFVKNDFNLK